MGTRQRARLVHALAAFAFVACDGETPPRRSAETPQGEAEARPPAQASVPAVDAPARQTTREWWDKEFGVGVVSYAAMESYEARDVIRARPSISSDTVAVLDRDKLCFTSGICVRSYEQMVEFAYEIPGWAILGFTPDSGWARVTLAPFDTAGPTGWVALRGDSVRALLWSRILPEHSLFFLRPDDTAFYDAPIESARAARTLVRHAGSDRLNYIMNPLQVRDRWLRVELLSPSPMCEFPEPEVTPDTVWIQYLRADGRPRVFYYTRGC